MDIEVLKTFLEVRSTGHFGKAAENLYITQSAVSARIKQLEDALGVKVFTRTRNNLRLTAEGERLVPYAESVLVSWARATQDLAIKKEHSRQISIGTTAGLWRYVFQDKLPTLKQALPDIAVRAIACGNDDLSRLVLERSLDVALSYEGKTSPELASARLGKLKLVLCSTNSGDSISSALSGDYVFVDWGTAFGIFHAKRFGESIQAVLHTNMAGVAEAYLKSQSGAAYLPEHLLHMNGDRKLYRVQDAPEYFREIFLVYLAEGGIAANIKTISLCLTI